VSGFGIDHLPYAVFSVAGDRLRVGVRFEERDGTMLAGADRASGRRWFTSFGSCSIDEPLADLRDLGLVTP